MTKEQEAQQAQTIANEIESAKIAGNNKRVIDLLEEIVDSQAQKIAEQAKEIEILQRIKRAAISAEYYQGTEGTAQELEDALKMTTDQTTDSKEVV